MSYVTELSDELRRAGIADRRRARILAEIEDHLSCDPGAELGSPAELARAFADDLGTSRARRAGLVSFAALALTGTLCAVVFVTARAAGIRPAQLHASSRPLGGIALVLLALGAQVAFVAGSLGAVRAMRHRRDRVLARAQSIVIGRRAGVGLAAGLVTMAGLALFAAEFQHGVAGWWTAVTLSAAAVGTVALLAAAPAVLLAARVRSTAPGEPGDVFEDLGGFAPPVILGRPWTFALVVSAALAVAITIAGAGASDGYDGAARGIADALACLAGFAVLGRYLALRA